VDKQNNKKAARVFAEALASSLAEALTQAAGAPLQIKVLDSPDLGKRQGQPVHFRLTADGALQGECFIELYESQVAELGAKILGRPAAPYVEEHAEALAKAISAATPGLTAALAEEFGELTFKVERVANLAFGGMLVVPLAASMGEQPAIPLLLYFDGQFLEALASHGVTKDAVANGKPALDPVNLKLVMDVELNVALRFGQRQLPLREVLELASGSVIELDRQVDDPVELLLDGKVIARGEAVIVDGNYGLRVTEVPQPIESHLRA
jgi:flagellar motor switch protein FliN/FliY